MERKRKRKNLEKPMTRMLRVRLTQIKTFDIGRVSFQNIGKEVVIIGQVSLIPTKTRLIVDVSQSLFTLLHHRDLKPTLRFKGRSKRSERSLINALGHGVVKRREQLLVLFLLQRIELQRRGGLNPQPPRSFHPLDTFQPTRLANTNGISGKGR